MPLRVFSLGEDLTICPSHEVFLKPSSIDIDGNNYVWQDGTTSPSYLVKQEGTYTLKIHNECGEAIDDVKVSYQDADPKDFSNVISPNSDGKNDYFQLPFEGIRFPVEIINRWGQAVYFNPSYENDWYPKDLSSGVYFWRCIHPCFGEIKGTVSVLH